MSYSPGRHASTSNTLGQHAAPWRGTPPALATSTSTAAGRCAPHFSAALLPHPGLRVKVTGHATPGPHAKLRSMSKSRTPPPWPEGADTGDCVRAFLPSFVKRRWMRVGRIVDCAADPGTGGLGSLEVWGGGRGGELGQRFKRSPGCCRRGIVNGGLALVSPTVNVRPSVQLGCLNPRQ